MLLRNLTTGNNKIKNLGRLKEEETPIGMVKEEEWEEILI